MRCPWIFQAVPICYSPSLGKKTQLATNVVGTNVKRSAKDKYCWNICPNEIISLKVITFVPMAFNI
jgi:hypothetical protein